MLDFIRLKGLCSEFINREVDIVYCTYSLKHEKLNAYISAIVSNPFRADILIFANKCKNDEMIIKAIAHELAHVLAKTTGHGKRFQNKWDETEKLLSKRYYSTEYTIAK